MQILFTSIQTKYGTNEKRFTTLEESLTDLRTETEQTLALSSKESKTTKLEIDRLKAFDAKVESDVFVMRTVISDMNTSTNAIKNSALEVSKSIAILKTENEINKMEKDFNLLKITTVQNELEESKIIMNHLRSTNNISKIEQLDRVVNLEYEISKIKNRQFDDLDETQKSSPSTPTKELNKYNDKFSNIEKGMLALTSDVSFLGERVDRLEPLELKVLTLHHVISNHVMSCHFKPCHVISFQTMLCHVLSCHVVSCHVMSYHIISYHITHH